jgi:hypothetical protein
MIRAAGPDNTATGKAVRPRKVKAEMLLRSDLRANGPALGGLAGDHPHAMRRRLTAGQCCLAPSRGGMLMPHRADGDMPSGLTFALALPATAVLMTP